MDKREHGIVFDKPLPLQTDEELIDLWVSLCQGHAEMSQPDAACAESDAQLDRDFKAMTGLDVSLTETMDAVMQRQLDIARREVETEMRRRDTTTT